jgi:hypothetical protein
MLRPKLTLTIQPKSVAGEWEYFTAAWLAGPGAVPSGTAAARDAATIKQKSTGNLYRCGVLRAASGFGPRHRLRCIEREQIRTQQGARQDRR